MKRVVSFLAPVGVVAFSVGAYMTDSWSLAFLDAFAALVSLREWWRATA